MAAQATKSPFGGRAQASHFHNSPVYGSRRRFIIGGIAMKRTLYTLVVASVAFGADDTMERARRIQSELIGIDSHIDTMQRVLMEHVDLGRRLPDGEVDLPRLREGGMHAPFFALWVPTFYKGS